MPKLSDKVELKRKGEKNPNPKIIKLGKKITDVVAHKLMGVTSEDAEYWGLADIVTDEMADIALKMKVRHHYTVSELHKLCKVKEEDKEKFQKLLDEMSYIGLLEYDYGNHYDHNGRIAPQSERRYCLPMFVPGSAELLNMEEVRNEDGSLSNNRIEKHPEVAAFFERMTFVPLAGITQMLPPGGDGVGMHVIPVEKAIELENTSVDLEHISYWLKKYEGHIGVGQCSCRASRAKLEEGCADDQWGWCIGVGDFADYCRETGKGHDITYEEAMEILKKAEDNGFVHQITNIDGENKIFGICNCNVNICNGLRTSQLFNTPNMSKSAYTAYVEKNKCVACGRCVEYCPAGAVKLGQKLCSKDGEIKYPKQALPNKIKWSKAMWNENYRDDNRINTHETGTAPCKATCPAHIAVQGYLKMAGEGRYKDALALIKKQNPFPAICGRVCNRKCEEACTRNNIDAPVSIDAVKKFIAEQDLNSDTRYVPDVVIASSSKKHWDEKIAIIGAGPAGLSCAYYLATMGYLPTVFEKNAKPGGMLTYGIPSYKLEKDVIEAEIDVLRELGVEIKCNVEVGKDITISKLKEEGYKAFYIAIGCQGGNLPNIEGIDAKGVSVAVSFLHEATENNKQVIEGDVIVVGGGNVAIDCARTAHRFKANSVKMVCLEDEKSMPSSKEEIYEAKQENIEIINSYGPKEIIKDKKGNVTQIVFKKCLSTIDEETKAFSPVYDENDTITLKANKIIFAIGQKIIWNDLLKDTKVTLRKNGAPLADALTYQSADKDIFVGGDVYTGPRFAIDAIAAGKIAAESLHRYVHKGASLTIGRNKWQFASLDKENLEIGNYDEAGRQEAGMDESIDYKNSFVDAHKTLTKEQVQIETSRCLGCGVTVVDENKCIGCGICTTKCEFDAIHLKRDHPEMTHMIPSEKKIGGMLKYSAKRAVKIVFAKKNEEEKAAIKYQKEYKKKMKKAKKEEE